MWNSAPTTEWVRALQGTVWAQPSVLTVRLMADFRLAA